MATTNLVTYTANIISYQTGNGVPNHTALIHSQYKDLSSGISYENTNGGTSWATINTIVNTLEVCQFPTVTQFSSIAAALASITGNTSTNRFVIKVFPGEYIEVELDFAAKPYVSLVGSSIQSVVIKPDTALHHIIKLGELNEISFCWLEDAGAGYAGLAMIDSGDYSQCHKVTFNNCDIGILISATSVDTYFYGEYVDFNGLYSYGVKVISSGGFEAYGNIENVYNLPQSGTPVGYHVNGTVARLDLLAGGNKFLGLAASGTGILVEDGGFADVSAMYFQNFTTAISLPNVGTAMIAQFSNVSLFDNTTAISVQHVSAQGNFQGQCNSPVISIVSGSMFGITYLERLLGNKKSIEFDGLLFNLTSGITPTTTAATTAVLTATGTRLVSFPGGNSDNAGCSVMFQIPSDYQSGGTFKVVYTSATGTPNNFKLNFILTKKAIGDDFANTTETGLSVIEASTTQYQKRETSVVTPATAFAVGDNITIRMYRLGNDVDDTFTSNVYIVNLLFEYESNK